MKLNGSYKILIIKIFAFTISSLVSFPVFSQIFSEEQNPLSVKWRRIDVAGFRLIYPDELEKEAQRMANTISHIYPFIGSSLKQQKTSLPLLLQNRGVVANGFVQLAPKKSEFYTTPPQQFDSQDWLNNLAVHELRHVAQFDKLTNGKAFPFPEEIYFAWFGASIPTWFFEGDAVTIETALSNSGRGRQPAWIMPYRASLLEGKKISYSKAYFGSDRDVTPGYYQLGYLMATGIRTASGRNVFDSVLTDIRKRPLRPYPFSNSLKKYTGMGTKAWFEQTAAKIKQNWSVQETQSPYRQYEVLNRKAAIATSYFLPVRLPDSRILALKQSKAAASHFVLIDSNKKEQRLFGIAGQEQPWFSYANGKIVWDEVRYDPRYRQRSYSVICSYDLKTHRTRKLSSRSRLFSPSLSPDGNKIVAVSIDLSNKSQLTELDATTGKVLNTLPNPDNRILQTPAYDQSGKMITYVSVTEQGKALWTTDLSGKAKKIIDETRQQLGRPVYFDQGIIFNAHYNGINNIYSIDTAGRKIIALSASKYGAFNATPDLQEKKHTGRDTTAVPATLLFSNYSAEGFDIAALRAPAGSTDHSPGDHFVYFGKAAEIQEEAGNVFRNIPDSTYSSRRYHSLGNLFNVHSIVPVIDNEYKGGLQLQSSNLLNTLDFFAGADYYRDLNRFEYNTGFSFKALYPILRASYRNRPRRTFYDSREGMQQGDWRENVVQLQASVPLRINALNHNYNFSFNALTSYTTRYATENLPANFIRTVSFPVEYNATFAHSLTMAPRDIAPRWAQTLRFTYMHQPFAGNLNGRLFAAEGFLYFPGLGKNHSFLANFNYQTATGVRSYDREINSVYGYNNIRARSMLKNTLLFNYRFPFAFPDAEIGPLAYIRNLRAGLFCHYENIGLETNLAEPKTYGFELRSSMHLLRYQPLVDLGARFVFVNKVYHQNPILELIFDYSF